MAPRLAQKPRDRERVPARDPQERARAHARRALVREIARSPKLRLDAAAAAFLERQLTQVLTTVFEVEYDPLRAFELIPMTSEADPGAATVEYELFEDRGVARVIANYADDVPTVDVGRDAFPTPVFDYGIAWHWTDRDLRRQAFAERQGSRYRLSELKPRAARRAVERALDAHAAFGIPAMGVAGFLNHPNVTGVPVTNGDWLNPATTPAEILSDMVELVTAIPIATRENWHADTLVLPPAHHAKVAHTRMGADFTQTIQEAFEGSFSDNPVSVESWSALEEADDGDPMAVAYARDPDVVRVEVPTLYDEMPAERRNLVWQIIATATIAGTLFHRPKAAAYGTGI
jgi:hypothetical protein